MVGLISVTSSGDIPHTFTRRFGVDFAQVNTQLLLDTELVKALSEGRRDDAVTVGMSRERDTVDEAAPLKSAVESMRERQCATMPVVASGRIVGLLTLENISEIIMVNAAMDHRGAGHSLPPTLSTQNL
jgi:predicted transcriptional regulator